MPADVGSDSAVGDAGSERIHAGISATGKECCCRAALNIVAKMFGGAMLAGVFCHGNNAEGNTVWSFFRLSEPAGAII